MESLEQYLNGIIFLESKLEAVCGENDSNKPVSAISLIRSVAKNWD